MRNMKSKMMKMNLETSEISAKRMMMSQLKVSGTLTSQIIQNLNLNQPIKNLMMKGVSVTSMRQLNHKNKPPKVQLKIRAS